MKAATFWDRAAPKYAKDPITDMEGYTETLGRIRHHLQPTDHVLEMGCGTGSTALELAPGVASYHGTDVSSEMIRIARGKLSEDLPMDLSFEVAAAGDLPPQRFDAILALNLLHLLPDLEEVVARVYAALPSGGLFIAKTGLLREGLFILPLLIPLMRAVGKAPFVRSLGEKELRRILQDAGFEEVETIRQKGIAPRFFTVHRKP